MKQSKAKILRDTMASGRIGNIEIGVSVEPRIVIKTATKRIILSARTGRESNDDAQMMTHMREILTHDHLQVDVNYTAVDRKSLQTEQGKFRIVFRGFDCDESTGQIVAGRLVSYIHAISDDTTKPQTAEALAGMESEVTTRIIFNIPDSKPSDEVAGYDRKHEGKNATVWINTNDGKWFAKRTEAGKACLGVLAEVGLDGLTPADILDAALQAAPKIPLEH